MEGTNLTEIYRLSKEDVPGASLCGQSPDDLNVEQLKRDGWPVDAHEDRGKSQS